MIEVYRGSPNAWECDEMGHMNVRFYISKLIEGLGVFCFKTGMPHAFRPNAPSTVELKDLHIRFVKEAHAGAPIYMRAGVVEIKESSALLYMQLNHLDGAPCAVFRLWIDHIDIHTGKPFLWSPKTIAAFKTIPADMPEKLAPRSLPFDVPPNPAPTIDAALEIGALEIGSGLIMPDHCDVFGNMKTECFIGRISDSTPHFIDAEGTGLSRSPKAHASGPRIGTAALEYRFAFHNTPTAGDIFQLFAGSAGFSDKTFSLYYWLMDPYRNTAFATVQATLIQFDLDERKAITPPAGAFEAIEKVIPRGMWL
ncbi:thioesterase family protein [Hirschia litorea]|uniref:Thioesterase family protein n=1 Tax=Hirschia litorea TaxID=1199156 RepID=A0ABW2IJV4_9PROT